VLVSNIGNNDHGVTIVRFGQRPGTGHVFNTGAGGDGVLGPAGLVFDNGKLLVGNSTGNSVLVLNPNGTLFKTITSPLFNGPWGITVGRPGNDNRGLTTFFTANKFDGKIMRVDITTSHNGKVMRFKVVQIGQYGLVGNISKIDMHWLPTLRVGNKVLNDVLLTIDPANNRVAAFARSSTLQAIATPVTVFQGTPLNNPGGLAINPLNGDILVVNLNDNNLVELNARTRKVVGVKAIDPAIVDAQGNNSALFGVVAIKDAQGNLKVFFTDDNTNTLDVLSR
jgi:DNA-binding beta-propeller fold protein YncE